MSLSPGSRSTPPHSPIRTSQLVDWTFLQRAICLGTLWNWCPHLPEAINSKYDFARSCTTTLLPSEWKKVELRRGWRGGGKRAPGPWRMMGNYFRQIYTCSHAECWVTVFNPRGHRKQKSSSLFFWRGEVAISGQLRTQGGKRGEGSWGEGSWWREEKVRWLIRGAAQGQPPLLGSGVKWVRHWVPHLMHCFTSRPRLRRTDEVVTQYSAVGTEKSRDKMRTLGTRKIYIFF